VVGGDFVDLNVGEKFFILQLDDEGLDRLRFWLKIDLGKIDDFVVQYETYVNEEWFPVMRYDLAHNYFHRDVLTIKGERAKRRKLQYQLII